MSISPKLTDYQICDLMEEFTLGEAACFWSGYEVVLEADDVAHAVRSRRLWALEKAVKEGLLPLCEKKVRVNFNAEFVESYFKEKESTIIKQPFFNPMITGTPVAKEDAETGLSQPLKIKITRSTDNSDFSPDLFNSEVSRKELTRWFKSKGKLPEFLDRESRRSIGEQKELTENERDKYLVVIGGLSKEITRRAGGRYGTEDKPTKAGLHDLVSKKITPTHADPPRGYKKSMMYTLFANAIEAADGAIKAAHPPKPKSSNGS